MKCADSRPVGRSLWGAAIVVSLILASDAPAEEWPRWRGPHGDGTWQGPKLPEAWPAEGLRVRWRQAIGGGYAGVSVAGGRVFVMDRQQQPQEVERVLCFDAATGQPLWRDEYKVTYGELDYGSGPRAAPTVFEGRVYTLGAVGHVRCLNAADGSIAWSHDCVEEFNARIPEWGFAASPLIHENLVIVHVAAEPGGCLMAFDRDDGREVWRSSSDPAGYATPIVIDRAGGPQLVAWTPERVLGLSPRTGQIEWSVPYKVTYGVSIATPICQEGLVFVAGYWEGSKAIRLGGRRSEVELAWEDNDSLRGLMSQPLYRDGFAYLLDKRFGLTCFELRSGRKLWDDGNKATPRGRNPQASLVWLGDGDRAMILNSEGELILARLNPQGYQEQSRVGILGPTWAHPAYAGRMVYARDDQELVAVELPLADGQRGQEGAKGR
ncbi:MAG: PQQ-binding-like beta-propeller repeat protein [Pirellulales bacterium]